MAGRPVKFQQLFVPLRDFFQPGFSGQVPGFFGSGNRVAETSSLGISGGKSTQVNRLLVICQPTSTFGQINRLLAVADLRVGMPSQHPCQIVAGR